MVDPKHVQKYPILDLYMVLNVKDNAKARRVLKLIQKALELPLHIEDIYKSGKSEFSIFSYVISEYEGVNDSIVWALITLDKLGQEWYIESPNLNHKEYWKFKGIRKNEWNTFKINGIKEINFYLSNIEKNDKPTMVIS